MSKESEADSKGQDDDGSRKRRLKGMRIRDEFLCPITHELLREPVVSCDGHTYEKNAIEKWLRTRITSPMTGEEMKDKSLTSNINLKKLVKDLIDEGGAGLYTTDLTNQSRLFDVSAEKVLLLKCLGPPESDWNQQIFQVSPVGCFGGRKLQDVTPGRDVMLFRDTTVSRKHFEVSSTMGCNYFLRDLGSAGGTFIRIAMGEKKLLHPGTILLMGKHQFLVSSVDEGTGKGNNSNRISNGHHDSASAKKIPDTVPEESSELKRQDTTASTQPVHEQAVITLMNDAEQLLQVLEVQATGSAVSDSSLLGQRMRSFHERVSALVIGDDQQHPMSPDSSMGGGGGGGTYHTDGKGEHHIIQRMDTKGQYEDDDRGGGGGHEDMEYDNTPLRNMEGKSSNSSSTDMLRTADLKSPAGDRRRSSFFRETRKCTLTCFTPDGSPLQGVSFTVGPQGGTIGRKPTNTISLCITHPIDTPSGAKDSIPSMRITHIDSAVSGEHARIDMDPNTGDFYITDGAAGKSSTNGTWYRLSGPYQESPPHAVRGGMEVLIGTIRFQISESMTIAEHAVTY